MPVLKESNMSIQNNISKVWSNPFINEVPWLISKQSLYGTITVYQTISKNIKVSQNVLYKESGDRTPLEGIIELLLY